MPYITTSNENLKLYFEEFGSGQPIILIHGWPLSGRSWELQIENLLDLGYRVITYDRRGFGRSDVSSSNYDYDILASDLNDLINELELSNVVLAGFSMGGGKVVRYLTNYGDSNIDKIALISSIIPIVKQTSDNPDGVPQEKLQEILTSVKKERVTFLDGFLKDFYGAGLLSNPVSDEQLKYDWSIAAGASPIATVKCAESWASVDFREEADKITVPTLIVHGDDDKIVPMETAGKQASQLIVNSSFVVMNGAPHGLNVTHAEELNNILSSFLGRANSEAGF